MKKYFTIWILLSGVAQSLVAPNNTAQADELAHTASPVIGDISEAQVNASSLNLNSSSASLMKYLADTPYIHNYGMYSDSFNRIIDMSFIKTLLSHATRPTLLRIASDEAIPANHASELGLSDANINRLMIIADGQMFDKSDESSHYTGEPDWMGGHLSQHIGEGVLAQDFEPKFGIMRDREYNSNNIYDYATYRKPAPISSDFFVNNAQWVIPAACKSPSSRNYDGYWCAPTHWGSSEHVSQVRSSSNTGTIEHMNDMYLSGRGGYGSNDIGRYDILRMSGTNWTWGAVNELHEKGGLAAGGYVDQAGRAHTDTFQHFNYEWDMGGIGPDHPDSAFNPVVGNRKAVWYDTFIEGGDRWEPLKKYHEYQIVIEKDSKNTEYMYENTVEGGTSSSVKPSWRFNETAPIADGTANWVFLGKKTFQIGCLMCFGSHGETQFGTLLGSSSHFYNSPIDLSTVKYDTDIHTVFRTQTNSYFDLSDDATRAGQNNHLLGYGNIGGVILNSLNYTVSGSSVFHIEDDGIIGVTYAEYEATGTDIGNSPKMQSLVSDITKALKNNSSVRLGSINTGDISIIRNHSGRPITVYPLAYGWTIDGAQKYTLDNNDVALFMVTKEGKYTVLINTSSTKSNNTKSVDGAVLPSKTKKQIFAISDPIEGMSYYNSDDHAQVTYRCPTRLSCAWYPVQYGAALRN